MFNEIFVYFWIDFRNQAHLAFSISNFSQFFSRKHVTLRNPSRKSHTTLCCKILMANSGFHGLQLPLTFSNTIDEFTSLKIVGCQWLYSICWASLGTIFFLKIYQMPLYLFKLVKDYIFLLFCYFRFIIILKEFIIFCIITASFVLSGVVGCVIFS